MGDTSLMLHGLRADRLSRVLARVEELQHDAIAGIEGRPAAIGAVPAARRPSAENLARYLALRVHDLRPLQRELAELSISSLGRMEGHVAGTLHGVRLALLGLLGELPDGAEGVMDVDAGAAADRLLCENTASLLGDRPTARDTRIMVTLPAEATHDRVLLRELLRAGMDVVRINLAHDDAAAWNAMVEQLRAAEAESGRRCRIFVDLPGPKLRTGAIEHGPRVVRIHPERDALGRVVAPACAVFHDPLVVPSPGAGATSVPLAEALSSRVQPGDDVVVTDTRDRERRFRVTEVNSGSIRATVDRTAYVGADCDIELRRDGVVLARSRIGPVPPLPGFIPLRVNDLLVVTCSQAPGSACPAAVPCTLPEVFQDVRPGQRILFDDGKIAGLIVAADADELHVRITGTAPGGGRLRAEKGINLPDTYLRTSALTAHDLQLLDWVAQHADVVGMSFVQHAEDVLALQAELARRGRADLGIVLKIETATAFRRLPELLFAGLRGAMLGVMVARGDLAVEVGYLRLAEVQEEILWLCEAAHVPVIWATAVLDSMAHTGIPSRSEITDAAMGVRAECVMLNKGPCIVETVRFLGGVLERMQEHHAKKRSMLRRLNVAGEPHSVP